MRQQRISFGLTVTAIAISLMATAPQQGFTATTKSDASTTDAPSVATGTIVQSAYVDGTPRTGEPNYTINGDYPNNDESPGRKNTTAGHTRFSRNSYLSRMLPKLHSVSVVDTVVVF